MKEEKSGTFKHELNRRTFIKYSAMSAASTALPVGFNLLPSPAEAKVNEPVEEKKVVTICRGNCNCACMHEVSVRNGVAHNIAAAPYPDPAYNGICLRGFSNIQRTYNPNRVKYPMRRVGERGSGKWERISWDEAIKEIGEKLCHFRDTYGGTSIVKDCQSGNQGMANGPRAAMAKFASCIGTTVSGDVYDRNSCAGTFRVMGVAPYDFSNEPGALMDSKMIVIWGTNPVYTEPHVWRFIMMAQEAGAKVVCLDPVKTATAHKADQFIPVVPGSDLMLVLAMCNYMIENGLINEEFLKTRSNGPFLVRRDNGEMYTNATKGVKRKDNDYYVYDPVAGRVLPFAEAGDIALEGSFTINDVEVDTAFTLLKNHLKQYTIAEASKASGISEKDILEFINTYATIGPVTINIAYGLDHYHNGHLFFQAVSILQALTANLGRPGAGFTGMFRIAPRMSRFLTTPINSVPTTEIPSFHLYNVWRDQEYKGKPYTLKAIITAASNPMNNYSDQNRWFNDIFPNLEYWIVIDKAWCDSANYADIVLPVSDWLEVMDFRTGQNSPYTVFGEKVIEPLYESKPDSEIFTLIANAMGYAEDFPKEYTQEDWAKAFFDNDDARARNMTWEQMRKTHAMRWTGKDGEPLVQGDKHLPFPTSHGRLMLYWEDPVPRADFGQEITPEMIRKERMPYFTPPKEAWKDNPLYEKYPLVFLQLHERYRTHTQYFDVPLLNELGTDPAVRLSRQDAESRGIKDGDIVEVYNDRGHAVVQAIIDDSFATGVTSIAKGWQRHQFISGCYSELIGSDLDPWGVSATYYDTLVNVRKWNK